MGVNVKKERTDCNFQIDFRWNDERKGYTRAMCNWQHSHELTVPRHTNLIRSSYVQTEMKIYAEVDLPPA
jgi:hypothetical protein